MRYVVVRAHVPGEGVALVLRRGERLRWERRPTEWDGWLYCESERGIRGWVPEAWLLLDGESAEIARDYDATELGVEPGDHIEGDVVESGWLLATDGARRRGWVPLACVEAAT